MDQGKFLLSMGIETRAATLARDATPDRIRAIKTDLHRLVAPNQMGTLFQVMAVTHPDLDVPDGFRA